MGLSGPASVSQFMDTPVGQTRTHSTVLCAKPWTLGLSGGAISHCLSTRSPPWPSGFGPAQRGKLEGAAHFNWTQVVWSAHPGIRKTGDPITEQQP